MQIFHNDTFEIIHIQGGITSRDHSNITSAKKWVGGVRKLQFLQIYSSIHAVYSTIYTNVGGQMGLKNMLT